MPLREYTKDRWTDTASSNETSPFGTPTSTPTTTTQTSSPFTSSVGSNPSPTGGTTSSSGGSTPFSSSLTGTTPPVSGGTSTTPASSFYSNTGSNGSAYNVFTNPPATYTPPPSYTPQAPAPSQTFTLQPGVNYDWANYVDTNPDALANWNAIRASGRTDVLATDKAAFGQYHWQGDGQRREVPIVGAAQAAAAAQARTDWTAKANDLAAQIHALYNGDFASFDQADAAKRQRDFLAQQLDKLASGALSDYDTSMIDRARMDVSSFDSAYQRASTADAALRQFINQMNTGLLNANLTPVSDNYQQWLGELNNLSEGISGYSSLKTMYDQAIAKRDQLQAVLQSGVAKTAAEKERIANFRNQLTSQIQALEDQMATGGIAGIGEKASTYEQMLRDYGRQLSGFRSDLPSDFSSLIAELQNAQGQYTTLLGNRDKEQARINALMAQYGGQLDALRSSARSFNPYDATGYQNLQDQLDDLAAQMGKLSSPLGVDMGSQQSEIGQIRAAIDQLKARHSTLLDNEKGSLNNITQRLAAAPDYDELTLNMLSAMLDAEGQNVSRFTGSDADELMQLLTGTRNQITDRRFALTGKRNDIESQLQSFLDSLKTGNLATLDDVKAQQTALNPYATDLRRYNATQGQDELDASTAFLNQAQSRITADNKAAQDRETQAANAVRAQLDRRGNLVVPGSGVVRDVLTEAQRTAGRKAFSDMAYGSAFSANLGL